MNLEAHFLCSIAADCLHHGFRDSSPLALSMTSAIVTLLLSPLVALACTLSHSASPA